MFGNKLSSIGKMGINYDTSNLALVRVSYLKDDKETKEENLLITSLVFSDRIRKQVVSCYDGNNYVYFFGEEPSQCSIGGIVPASGLKTLRDAYKNQKESTVTISIKGESSFKCIIDDFSYSVGAESASFCNVTMHLIKVS